MVPSPTKAETKESFGSWKTGPIGGWQASATIVRKVDMLEKIYDLTDMDVYLLEVGIGVSRCQKLT